MGAMRADMPPIDALDAVASHLIGATCKIENVEGVAVIAYDGNPADAAVGDALARHMAACGLADLGRFYVTGNQWGTIGSGDAPEELPEAPEGVRAMVARTDQADDGTAPEVTAEAREKAAAVFDREIHNPTAVYADVIAAAEAAVTAASVTAEAAGLLAAAMNRPAMRDVMLVQWVAGIDTGNQAAVAQIAWEEGHEYPQEFAAIIWGDAPRPDADRLTRALEVARQVLAHTPDTAQAGPLSVVAWLSLALGRSSQADTYAARAQRLDPEHGLAQIIRAMIHAGHLPEWAFTR